MDEADGGNDAANGKKGGIGELMRKHQRLMKEAALDRQWEMMLLKAQLRDAEDKIHLLEKELHPETMPLNEDSSEHALVDEEGKWSPSSLLSLRRVSIQCKPGELVAVVGAVGSGKVNVFL